MKLFSQVKLFIWLLIRVVFLCSGPVRIDKSEGEAV